MAFRKHYVHDQCLNWSGRWYCGRRWQRNGRGQCSGSSEVLKRGQRLFLGRKDVLWKSFVKRSHGMCSTAPTGRQEVSNYPFCPLVHFECERKEVCPITSQLNIFHSGLFPDGCVRNQKRVWSDLQQSKVAIFDDVLLNEQFKRFQVHLDHSLILYSSLCCCCCCFLLLLDSFG